MVWMNLITWQVYVFFQMLRIIQLEHYFHAAAAFKNTWITCKPSIKALAVVALIIWFGSGAILYEVEGRYPMLNDVTLSRMNGAAKADNDPATSFNGKEKLTSGISSIFYTQIFLNDEWCFCDFTVGGKIWSLCYLLIAIALWAMPIGILVDALQDEIDEPEDEDDEDDDENKEKEPLTP